MMVAFGSLLADCATNLLEHAGDSHCGILRIMFLPGKSHLGLSELPTHSHVGLSEAPLPNPPRSAYPSVADQRNIGESSVLDFV
jgi:hypothetical protein